MVDFIQHASYFATPFSLKTTYMQHDMAEFHFHPVIQCLRAHVMHVRDAVQCWRSIEAYDHLP